MPPMHTSLGETQKLQFYQKGTFTVGNRLVSEQERAVQASQDRSNALTCGHRACQGCGEALGARYALDAAIRATNGNVIAANATGCLEVFTTPYPETSWQLPWVHSLFGNAAAVATGVAAAMRVKGHPEVRAIAQGGDGGTTASGFGCLSRRGGRKGAVPPGIPHVATATVADLHDLERKATKAMSFRGARYLHIHVPCPLGWGSALQDTIRLARLAVEHGLFPGV